MPSGYDAILLVSFGGPERPQDVIPFLENVLRGKPVPKQRLLEVADHYQQLGGTSPLNAQMRTLRASLREQLDEAGPRLPVYWGNRNWHPLLGDTVRQMAQDGITRALAFVTSAYSSYSSCRQYQEDIQRARAEVGTAAPEIDKIRPFFNHPGFIEPMVESVSAALNQVPTARRATCRIVYTAHSIPLAMSTGCLYTAQLQEACRLVSQGVARQTGTSIVPMDRVPMEPTAEAQAASQAATRPIGWQLAYQSRSGSPAQPWLEPDISDALRALVAGGGVTDVIVLPIGFVSDHMEVLFDLDTEARELADQLGLSLVRASTVGNHPRFVRMIRQLVLERIDDHPARLALGSMGPRPDACPADCCPAQPPRRGARS